ncbi:hypothetical protein J8L85_00210 [Maribacter sp. MMG018]|uniref:DUF6985 domain-containing protein n=1 Tax=Maribacter sp. MMG018 TaxID=2822688 RepID=UPI001B37DB08|nr:hypothetical protein [Maribacter sp. MMG018]MBQ4912837.1 hypothetical protein [Maribacter sp. MMG018]
MNSILEQIKAENEKFGEIDIQVDNFICKDWNVYYNLYNPENFEDPENSPEWYDVSEVYEYYETPFSTSDKISFYSSKRVDDFQTIKELIEKSAEIEKKLLTAIVNYTFGNGGAYASAKHYEYAKRTMEILHKTEFSNEEFIKKNLCIDTISFGDKNDELELLFNCSWNEEHGLKINLKNNEIMSIE